LDVLTDPEVAGTLLNERVLGGLLASLSLRERSRGNSLAGLRRHYDI
jgi:hypothetical protein